MPTSASGFRDSNSGTAGPRSAGSAIQSATAGALRSEPFFKKTALMPTLPA
jgi:hypothetical protein